ncbi:hypothetical protein HQ560_11810 [bacterium]|nr:hypothetical protein [bacterium]
MTRRIHTATACWLLVLAAMGLADTFTSKDGKEPAVEGKLVGTATLEGVTVWFVRGPAGTRRLPVADWTRKATKAEVPKAWPAVTYKGKTRTPAWVAAQWKAFHKRLMMVEGVVVDTGTYGGHYHAKIGSWSKGSATVATVLSPTSFVLATDQGGVRPNPKTGGLRTPARAPGRYEPFEWRRMLVEGVKTDGLADGRKWGGELVCVGTKRTAHGTLLRCVPKPAAWTPLTREQFVEALKGGLKLYHYNPQRWKVKGMVYDVITKDPVK